jgi:hypothetical protein
MADELLRLARASNDTRTKLALIEMGGRIARHGPALTADVRPRGPSIAVSLASSRARIGPL